MTASSDRHPCGRGQPGEPRGWQPHGAVEGTRRGWPVMDGGEGASPRQWVLEPVWGGQWLIGQDEGDGGGQGGVYAGASLGQE